MNPVKDYLKELSNVQSWMPSSIQKIEYWRNMLSDARSQELDLGKELLNLLVDFMDKNPELYDERFRKYAYKDVKSILYSKHCKAFRIETTYGMIFLVPLLLVQNPEAYRCFRIKYLAEKERKKNARDLEALYMQRAAIDKKIDILVNKD